MARSTGDLRDALRVRPGKRIDLSKVDPSTTHGHSKETAGDELAAGLERLTDLQDRLWAEGRQKVLVVLQGIDAAGKDGTVRHVVSAFNPQGCSVTPFKVPSAEELAHDYLWRVHKRVPGSGEIAVFNRSHYEDVLVVRVHGLVRQSTWKRRYDHINAFEKTLADEGTTIVKFFLYIDRDEQKRRFQARLDDPTKNWKFRLGDLEERKRWGEYIAAFEDMLGRCSTDYAPWYVIPSNRKWFRNLAVAEILGDTLADLKPRYPKPQEDLTGVVVE
jgi:PPK2 family polyphosphate:nucleotide phosphotransferase